MRVTYKDFRGAFKSFDRLFQDAAEFATKVGPERLINISHSPGVVTVWYWDHD